MTFEDSLTPFSEGIAFTAAEMIMPIMIAPTKAKNCLDREEMRVLDGTLYSAFLE